MWSSGTLPVAGATGPSSKWEPLPSIALAPNVAGLWPVGDDRQSDSSGVAASGGPDALGRLRPPNPLRRVAAL